MAPIYLGDVKSPKFTCKNCGPLSDQQINFWKRLSCKCCTKNRAKKSRQKRKIEAPELFKANRVRWQKKHPDAMRRNRKTNWDRRGSEYNRRSIERMQRHRMKVLSHYSLGKPTCAKCGVTELRFLCLDHIRGEGKKHRDNIGVRGTKIFDWVVRNNFPPIFQILCWNCNTIKHREENQVDTKGSRYKLKIKREIFSHYAKGNLACQECGIEDLRVLTLDHPDGGGRQHRLKLGITSGSEFYLYLKRNGFPGTFNILCYNHNSGKDR